MADRFLLISSNSSGRGGGERYLVYLARGLREIGFEVHALLSQANYMDLWAKDLVAEKVHVHRAQLRGLRDRPLRFVQSICDFRQHRRVADICRSVAPRAILVNQQYDEDGLDFVAGALLANVAPVGGTMHMPMTAAKNRRPFGRLRGFLIQNWYSKHPYQIMAVSDGSRLELQNYYRLPKPPKTVHYGCPINELSSEMPSMPAHWDSSVPTFGFCGQFVEQKNLDLLIDSWLELGKSGIKSQLLLVGDGKERKRLEDKLRSSSRFEWHITGWQDRPERYLRYIDVYVMTSHFEGLPLALLEAVGRGLPAVATNFNGAFDVAERASWVKVVERADVVGVASALNTAIDQLAGNRQLALEGKDRFCQYFSVERMAADTSEAIRIE